MSEQFEFNFKLSLEMTWSIYKKSSVKIKFLAYLLDDIKCKIAKDRNI